ncbi:redoxin family protein [Vogesella fluminis]|uniref:Thiol peroxidase n=1 Tax=Vogesella fluminis TaxID=1069161 RepID=A0ABQ3H761_9NEIS|nr:redoxin family protein [Vogesella fluminis]GHD74082.1 putative thiol peroxidase [Vogesella fluminis]
MTHSHFRFADEWLAVDGHFPQAGDTLPSFMLVDEQLRDVSLEHFLGHDKLVVTLLSLDAPMAGLALLQELRRQLEPWPQLQLIVITVDSPFSLARARKEHGLPYATLLSTLRGRDFHKHFGVLIQDVPLSGMTCPALWLADGDDRIYHAQRLRHEDDEFDFAGLRQQLAARFSTLPR